MLDPSTIPQRLITFQGEESRYGSFGQGRAQTVNASPQRAALMGDQETSTGGPCTYSIDMRYSQVRLTNTLPIAVSASTEEFAS